MRIDVTVPLGNKSTENDYKSNLYILKCEWNLASDFFTLMRLTAEDGRLLTVRILLCIIIYEFKSGSLLSTHNWHFFMCSNDRPSAFSSLKWCLLDKSICVMCLFWAFVEFYLPESGLLSDLHIMLVTNSSQESVHCSSISVIWSQRGQGLSIPISYLYTVLLFGSIGILTAACIDKYNLSRRMIWKYLYASLHEQRGELPTLNSVYMWFRSRDLRPFLQWDNRIPA